MDALGARCKVDTIAPRRSTGSETSIKTGIQDFEAARHQSRATLVPPTDARSLQAKLDALARQAVTNRAKVDEINDRVGKILEHFDDANAEAMPPDDRLRVENVTSQASHILEAVRASLHQVVMEQADEVEEVATDENLLLPTTDFIQDTLDQSSGQKRRLTSSALQLTKLTSRQRAAYEEKISTLESALSDADHNYDKLQLKNTTLAKDVARLMGETKELKIVQTKLLARLNDAKAEREAALATLRLENETREAVQESIIRGLKRKELQLQRSLREAEERANALANSKKELTTSPSLPEGTDIASPEKHVGASPLCNSSSRMNWMKVSRVYKGAPVVYSHVEAQPTSICSLSPLQCELPGASPKTKQLLQSQATLPHEMPAVVHEKVAHLSATAVVCAAACAEVAQTKENTAAVNATRAGPIASTTAPIGVPFADEQDTPVLLKPQPQLTPGVELTPTTESRKVMFTANTSTQGLVIQNPSSPLATDELYMLHPPMPGDNCSNAAWSLSSSDAVWNGDGHIEVHVRFIGQPPVKPSLSKLQWGFSHEATDAGVTLHVTESRVQMDRDGLLVTLVMQVAACATSSSIRKRPCAAAVLHLEFVHGTLCCSK
ncbi:hypothetical protein ACHHYP_16941 [Achlya hypogyna]|uniref:Uncharacterized protein n=1 Tax=Achlya hypogyna TaxID=1202772 RepID=A0A1V9ZDS8_ACHHY|nr:hypothetical protein ACHHYP_16941 [Achlya hypogyna]